MTQYIESGNNHSWSVLRQLPSRKIANYHNCPLEQLPTGQLFLPCKKLS